MKHPIVPLLGMFSCLISHLYKSQNKCNHHLIFHIIMSEITLILQVIEKHWWYNFMGTCGTIWINESNEDKNIKKHPLSIVRTLFLKDFLNMTFLGEVF